MSLHLVGEHLSKSRSHYLAETGKLVQLMRGVYIDADDDADAIVISHAVRIAHYLYPRAYLAAASAVLLGPTPDGRLFLSARRKQRTRIRALEIIQNEAPRKPSIAPAIVTDGLGELRINVASIRQRFLEAFRLRSEHATAIDDGMRESLRARLIEEFGDPKAAADALWNLARENDWYREGEAAQRFLERGTIAAPAKQPALNLVVAWHGEPMGHLTHDGFEWRWMATAANAPPLIRQSVPGRLPPFIASLLPEGWLERVLKDADERAALRSGKHYMSNITVVERQADLKSLPPDVLATSLAAFTHAGRFSGHYAGPKSTIEEPFERNLAALFADSRTPRLSGVQIKVPMFLEKDGTLAPAIDTPFTHILKPAGTSGFEMLPLVEWTALQLGRAAGFDVPSAALVSMPDGMPPALVIERFDIRHGAEDHRRLALEDMCSVLDLPPDAKYDGTIERVARAVRSLSTAPEDDALTIVKRALFAWLIADGDMHLKNMALLKIADTGGDRFLSVRVAPLYDAVTTRILPGLDHDRLALRVNGKDDRLRRADFRTLASTAGLRASNANAAIDQVVNGLAGAVEKPELPPHFHEYSAVVSKMMELCRRRIDSI